MDQSTMEYWIADGLSRILDFDIPEDLIRYILAIETEKEMTEYLKTLLDFDHPHHKGFVLELVQRRFPPTANPAPKQKKRISKIKQQRQQELITANAKPPPAQNIEPETKTKKKTTFINLYSQEGKNAQVVLLKGRHHCDCQASKHELINNCLNCGRVVCKQEGSGPCLCCGNLVCTPEEQKELNSKTKASAQLMESLMDQSRPKGWESAVLHRNRLLEYDRTSERRTRVTDDDSDYFNANSVWLSSSEREKLEKYQQSLHEKKHASRLSKKITFDFAGRQIVEDKTIDYEVDEQKISDITRGTSGGAKFFNQDLFAGSAGDRDVAPGVDASLLQFHSAVQEQGYAATVKGPMLSQASRIQDTELQEMSDTGRCLSMHQPWASLLVEGIKMHEGRTWYTNHRGRLWIASTIKPPDQQIIKTLENRYRVLYPNKQLNFPPFYPTGCLLGCVTVDDCLPQEEYQKKYPEGESDSPYVFICSNAISLRLRFPVKGQHKICFRFVRYIGQEYPSRCY